MKLNFFKNHNKTWIVKIPSPAVAPIRISCDVQNNSLKEAESIATKVEAPKIVGIAIKNEKRVASSLLNPQNRAAVMHAPERLAPGIKARH